MWQNSDDFYDFIKKVGFPIFILFLVISTHASFNEKISSVEKELAVVKTVMIMKNIMPLELYKTPNGEKE
jgi:hypothetical protein